MDEQTIAAYNHSAQARCERYRLILPNELRRFVPAGFHADAYRPGIRWLTMLAEKVTGV